MFQTFNMAPRLSANLVFLVKSLSWKLRDKKIFKNLQFGEVITVQKRKIRLGNYVEL